jgi:hypothetical protein
MSGYWLLMYPAVFYFLFLPFFLPLKFIGFG